MILLIAGLFVFSVFLLNGFFLYRWGMIEIDLNYNTSPIFTTCVSGLFGLILFGAMYLIWSGA